MTNRRALATLKPAAWPAQDRLAWERAIRPAHPLDEPGPLAHHSAARLLELRDGYGRWLQSLKTQGLLDLSRSGLDELTPARLGSFLDALRPHLAPVSIAMYFQRLLKFARGCRPDADWRFLEAAVRRLMREAEPVVDRRSLLRPSSELLELGFDLMRTADLQGTAVHQSAQFRDGLIIALVTARPVRLGNLSSIRVGHHLVRREPGWWLTFEAKETKNRRPLELPWPDYLVEPLEQYLAVHRPRLLARKGRWNRGPHDGLWVSAHGSMMRPHQIWELIRKRTEAKFGKALTPHLFRHAAATSIAIEDPEHVRMSAAILGHSNLATTERYYNLATGLEALRRYQKTVQSHRDKSPRRR